MSDEIKELKALEQAQLEAGLGNQPESNDNGRRGKKRGQGRGCASGSVGGSASRRTHYPSLFWPLLLIGLGSYFLLKNLDMIDGGMHWDVFWSYWPLMIVFVGLKILAEQAPRPLAWLTTGMVQITAVVIFGGLLLLGNNMPILGALAPVSQSKVITSPAPVLPEVNRATLNLRDSGFGVNLSSLEANRPELFVSNPTGNNGLNARTTINHSQRAQVDLRASDQSFRPTYAENEQWQIGLNQGVVWTLRLTLANSPARLDLSDVQLSEGRIEAGQGDVSLLLPSGQYALSYIGAGGLTHLTLPAEGRPNLTVRGGAGDMYLHLPGQMEMELIVQGHRDRVVVPRHLTLVEDRGGGEVVYRTPHYQRGSDGNISMRLTPGPGMVTITSGGR